MHDKIRGRQKIQFFNSERSEHLYKKKAESSEKKDAGPFLWAATAHLDQLKREAAAQKKKMLRGHGTLLHNSLQTSLLDAHRVQVSLGL